MPWSLECVEGSSTGLRLELKPEQSLTVGRAAGCAQVFADDASMSSLHFVVAAAKDGLRLQNVSKTNGTLVNGALVETVLLQPGDLVQAGRTAFKVAGPAPSPYPAQVRIGGWGFEKLPAGWDSVEGAGFRLVEGNFPATITAMEETLPAGKTLDEYIGVQRELIRSQIPGAESQDPQPAQIRGVEQAAAVAIQTAAPGGRVVLQRQIYVVSQGVVGILTTTMLDNQAVVFRDNLMEVERGLSYFQG